MIKLVYFLFGSLNSQSYPHCANLKIGQYVCQEPVIDNSTQESDVQIVQC